MKAYKIKRKSDGKFSTGGGHPRWTKRGHIWIGGTLSQHLGYLHRHNRIHEVYKDCEIIEYGIIFHKTIPMTNIIKDSIMKKLGDKGGMQTLRE